jgi:membrane protein YqaA with SNARE-associated domain
VKVFMKFVAVVFVLIAAFLVYAVIAAIASTAGARVGVCIGYIAGAVILSFLAVTLWRRSNRPGAPRVAAVAGPSGEAG